MISESTEITSSELTKFINSNELVVLRATSGRILGFNTLLQHMLVEEFTKVNAGWIDLHKVNYLDKTIIDFVNIWVPRIGLPRTKSIFPGYYLFKKGKLIAYHPGTFEYSKEDENTFGVTAIGSIFTGLLVGILTKDPLRGLEIFLEGMEMPQASKVFDFFKNRIESKGKAHSQQKQKAVFNNELQRAYELLEVTPNSSDEEVKMARKKLIFKYHPDRNRHNQEECNRISAEINNAYDLIMNSRIKEKVSL